MSNDGGETRSRDEQGRTQTGRALALVVVVALIAVVVLRHTGSSVAGPTRSSRAAGAAAAATTTTKTPTTNKKKNPVHPTTSTTVAALIPPADTTVEVLNGLQTGPLAGNLSGRLRKDGYKTLPPDNTTTVTSTSAIYVLQSGYYPEAQRLAATLGLTPAMIHITRGVPAGAPVPTGVAAGSDLIVVIGTSLHALASRSVTPTTTSTSTTVPATTSTSAPSSRSTTTSTSTSSPTSTSTANSSTSTTSKSTSTTAP